MECQPCGKTFTGEVCYNQHLKSEKHKKKVLLNLRSQNSSNRLIPADQQPKLLQCTICSLTFGSLEDFQCHCLSPEHAKNVISKTGENGLDNNTISSSSSEKSGNNENEPIPGSDTILSNFDNQKIYQLHQYAQCDVCKKTFSGPEPYRQHMESEPHKKKVDLAKNHPVGGGDANQGISSSSVFTCEQCKKNFSGQIPYMQHMTSDTHKKKLQHLEVLKRFSASLGSDSEPLAAVDFNLQPSNTNPFYCKICNTQCSGIAPYEQHLRGSTHSKNASKVLFQNRFCRSQPAEPAVSVQPEDLSAKPNSDVCDGNSAAINQSCDGQHGSIITTIKQGRENDYVLPEMADKLRVMSTGELQDCVKMFKPDNPIDFDRLESKQMQIDKDENQMKNQIQINSINIDENQMEIKLIDKDENQMQIHSIDIDENQMEINLISVDENQMEINLIGNELPGENHQMEVKENGAPKHPLDVTESNVFTKCDLCNVPLLSVTDAFCHFESPEHYNRKWHSQ